MDDADGFDQFIFLKNDLMSYGTHFYICLVVTVYGDTRKNNCTVNTFAGSRGNACINENASHNEAAVLASLAVSA